MNLKDIKSVENGQFYLDKAIRKSMKYIISKRIKIKLEYVREIESRRVGIIKDSLSSDMIKILDNMPKTKDLNEFYLALIDNNIGADKLHENLGRIDWFVKKLNTLSKNTIMKIKDAKSENYIVKLKKEFIGRISSLIRKINVNLIFLNKAYFDLRNFPSIKDIYTISICGMPNVGKSTLLNGLTGANAEVKDYAFTTKGLMLGYIKNEGIKIQVIDNPGTLDRSYNKMNNIEKQAYLVLKYLTKYIIYVFDGSESCGFSIKRQIKHFKTLIKEFSGIDILVLINKKDISSGENISYLSDKLSKFKIMKINAKNGEEVKVLHEMIIKNYNE